MKASYNGTLIAEAPAEAIIRIEGNAYFPPSAIPDGALLESPTPYTCPWKGQCQYWSVVIDGDPVKDLAWSYPKPFPSAIGKVGSDFSGYVAFDPRVVISE